LLHPGSDSLHPEDAEEICGSGATPRDNADDRPPRLQTLRCTRRRLTANLS
jgi:hypothetical protein